MPPVYILVQYDTGKPDHVAAAKHRLLFYLQLVDSLKW